MSLPVYTEDPVAGSVGVVRCPCLDTKRCGRWRRRRERNRQVGSIEPGENQDSLRSPVMRPYRPQGWQCGCFITHRRLRPGHVVSHHEQNGVEIERWLGGIRRHAKFSTADTAIHRARPADEVTSIDWQGAVIWRHIHLSSRVGRGSEGRDSRSRDVQSRSERFGGCHHASDVVSAPLLRRSFAGESGAVVRCRTLRVSGTHVPRHRCQDQIAVVGYTDDAEGRLELVNGKSRMSHATLRPHITLDAGVNEARARELVDKAHHNCFIANSVSATVDIAPTFAFVDAPVGTT